MYLLVFLALTFVTRCLANPYPAPQVVGTGDDQEPQGGPHYHAMGDSYSAGPGAGDPFDNKKYGGEKCFRGKGAYGPKLKALNIEALGTFQFLSCTGHVTDNVTQYQFPDLQWHEVYSNMRVTLSIGGNDLLFSSYLKACLMGLPGTDCDKTKKRINNLIDDEDGEDTFYKQLSKVWKGYVRQIRGPPNVLNKVAGTWQTLYPLFFRDDTDRCDNVRISLGKLVFGPKMKKALRKEVNSFVSRANAKIVEHMERYRNIFENWEQMGSLHTVDYNPAFDAGDGHRLCEEYVKDGVGFSNKDVWFLGVFQGDNDDENAAVQGSMEDELTLDQIDPNTCNPDAGDLALSVGCSIVKYKAENPDKDLSALTLPKGLTKAFHPKSSGFNAARDAIKAAMFPHHRSSLRVLPLGDSITNGYKSTDGNGYRKEFYNLAKEERTVDMIGSIKAGNMPDNDNEGHDGATIAEISSYADSSLSERPNVVLLHAGTNDLGSDANAAGAPDRLAALIDKIISKCPDATVLVANIVPAANSARQARTNAYNDAVTSLVNSRKAAGKHVQLMHMNAAVTKSMLADGLHPNDLGYSRMGFHWYGGVQWADDQGWINDPVGATQTGSGSGGHKTCAKLPGWLPQGEIANGGGNGAAIVKIRTCSTPVCKEGTRFANFTECSNNCYEAQCSQNAGQPGVLCSGCPDTSTGPIEPAKCWCESTDGTQQAVSNPLGGPCSALDTGYDAVKFADIDGDGRDDYLWVDKDGKVKMYWNIGHAPDEGPNAGKVKWMPIGTIATGVGARGDQIRFADINGDGRADYIWVKDSGAAVVWFNLGFDANSDRKVTWHSATGEQIASGIGDGDGVRFADINGDGKDDFIHMDANAAVTLYINTGRRADGPWGWWNWGQVAGGVGGNRALIRFADMNGDGQADYCVVNEDTGRLDVWYNQGPKSGSWQTAGAINWWNSTTRNNKPVASGVSYLDKWTNGEMVQFGDLNKDGRDDYLYIGAKDSSVYAFINGC